MQHKTIGEYFRVARINAHVSVETVCEDTGLIEAAQLLALEKGDYRPPLDTLYGLVNAYNLNPDDFVELLYRLASEHEMFVASAATAKKQ